MVQIACPSCQENNELAEHSAEPAKCARCGSLLAVEESAAGVRECARCFNWERPGESGWRSQDRDGTLVWFCPGCSETLEPRSGSKQLSQPSPAGPAARIAIDYRLVPENCGTWPIVIGLILLIAGPLATLASGQRIFYGAVLVGTHVLLRGIYGRWTQTPYIEIPFVVRFVTFLPALILAILFVYYSTQQK